MSSLIEITTTTGSPEDANKIARSLVANSLAACVQVEGPITSIYTWKGAVETEKEWRLKVKTHGSLFRKVEQRIAELHPYDEPEILAVAVQNASAGYESWACEAVQDQLHPQ